MLTGENGSGAKLTEADAIQIIDRAAKGELTIRLAIEFGIERSAVQRLLRGETWKHLARPEGLPRRAGAYNHRGRIAPPEPKPTRPTKKYLVENPSFAIALIQENSIPEPMSGCWLWIGESTASGGYGRIYLGERRHVLAHRVSWEAHNGKPIPNGLWALHKCDQPACVNPDHLYPGTHAQNTEDMVRRNRTAKWKGLRCGEANPRAKLSWDDVPKIKSMVRRGISRRTVATLFAVSTTTINNLIAGRIWKP